MSNISITICGGGNLGHVLAGVLGACQNNRVRILTSRASMWQTDISVIDPCGKVYSGHIENVSSHAAEVIPGSSIVLLCVPGYLMESMLKDIRPYLSPDTLVGTSIAGSGFFFTAEKILQENFQLFGFQRVPYIARVDKYGQTARLLGYKKELHLGCRYCKNPEWLIDFWQSILKVPVKLLPSFFDAALSNSNPILHPSRLWGLWREWEPGTVYPKQTLFYEEWDDFSSEVLIACDEDFFNVVRHYPCTPGAIPRLLDYYESKTAAELTSKLRSIVAFKGIKAPMRQVEGGFIPDFHDRYFTEDIPYGLQIVKDLAEKASQRTPTIDKILQWYNDLPKEK